jgi:hypothetical protein
MRSARCAFLMGRPLEADLGALPASVAQRTTVRSGAEQRPEQIVLRKSRMSHCGHRPPWPRLIPSHLRKGKARVNLWVRIVSFLRAPSTWTESTSFTGEGSFAW